MRTLFKNKSRIAKIISGGQTGADQAGLYAARDCGIKTGGMAPKGWRTEAGPNLILPKFGLIESDSTSYIPRTKFNIQNSDATIILISENSPGSRLTFAHCTKIRKPVLIVNRKELIKSDAVSNVAKWISEYLPSNGVLNVAGNRESVSPGIFQLGRDFLVEVFDKVNKPESKTLPRVLNRHKDQIPPNAKYIGRGSPFGNKFVIGVDGDRDTVCNRFECEVLPTLNVEPLRGFDLVCYCAPKRCHGFSIYQKLYGVKYVCK